MPKVEVIPQKRPPRGLRPLLRAKLAKLMEELGYAQHAVTVILCSDRRIRELKRRYWGEDAPTDVLSFPTFEPGDPFIPPHLGDIWISLDTAQRQAREAGHTLEDEVLVLAAHALWHLLGHDHASEEAWQGFRRVQERILTL
ncbi:rRNA maturation RNase YbeY [Marinithermus hydrothermalis]|uniref:Endoribonuclease YbeY n=1 Tax=Marinithermus hydrothermalis (strain DSM 14884 / JCM 11576 / T1) TaxID=869210 RepID=F2NP68_MARHT|nr:rRNA maturation RNase YbeY [Marinithermus hydrothermalis]AEB11869.1 metalloprotease ybeY [Marinithermus hydrothermalis DSM 14884]